MNTSSEDSSPRNAARFAARCVGFLLTLAVVQALALAVIARVPVPASAAAMIQRLSNLPLASLEPSGNTGVRLAELEKTGPVDLLFAGSSHAYRSFDPSYFEARGLRTFNLGTTAQSPLNSVDILEAPLDQLRPKVMVYVLFWGVMSGDGVESFLDLVKNSSDQSALLRTALAIRDPRVFNALFLRAARGNLSNTPHWEPGPQERYVGSGYVENAQENDGRPYALATTIKSKPKQRQALEATLRAAKARGIKVLLIAAPVPAATMASLHNYADYRSQVEALSKAVDVPFVDFNDRLRLDDQRDFMDYQHLNKRGVAQFTPAVYQELVQRGFVVASSTTAAAPGR